MKSFYDCNLHNLYIYIYKKPVAYNFGADGTEAGAQLQTPLHVL